VEPRERSKCIAELSFGWDCRRSAICMHEIYIGAVLFNVMVAAGELFFIGDPAKTLAAAATARLTRLTRIYVPSLH